MTETGGELPPIVITDLSGVHPVHAWDKFAQALWADYLTAVAMG